MIRTSKTIWRVSAPLLGLMVLLTACPSQGGDTTVTPPPPTEPSVSILGKLEPWSDALKMAKSVKPPQEAVLEPKADLVASVNGSGEFELTLPKRDTMLQNYYKGPDKIDDFWSLEDLALVGCRPDTVQVNAPAGLEVLALNSLVTDNGISVAHTLEETDTKKSYLFWWFSNQEQEKVSVSLSGQGCLFGDVKLNLELQKGWNAVRYVLDTKANTVTYSSATLPGNRLSFKPNTVSAAQLSQLGLNNLNQMLYPHRYF